MSMAHFDTMRPHLQELMDQIERVIIGKRDIIELSIVALLANGHVLLEDVPGVGKTMLVKSIAKSMNASFQRIQFTPDLLPSDLTGLSIFNQKTRQFEFRPGPLMGNIILADEINRTSPKTQSALLEGMEDGHVTVDGETRQLGNPFFVMATQNPIEYEGTFPLPEAQLDRFLMKLKIGYPGRRDELEMLNRFERGQPIESLETVFTLEELVNLQKQVRMVYVGDHVKNYMIDIIQGTRNHQAVYLGVSPRGSLALMKAAQAYSFLNDRDYVVPDDVKVVAPFVLGHRILLKSEMKFEGFHENDVVKEVLETAHVPITKERAGS